MGKWPVRALPPPFRGAMYGGIECVPDRTFLTHHFSSIWLIFGSTPDKKNHSNFPVLFCPWRPPPPLPFAGRSCHRIRLLILCCYQPHHHCVVRTRRTFVRRPLVAPDELVQLFCLNPRRKACQGRQRSSAGSGQRRRCGLGTTAAQGRTCT